MFVVIFFSFLGFYCSFKITKDYFFTRLNIKYNTVLKLLLLCETDNLDHPLLYFLLINQLLLFSFSFILCLLFFLDSISHVDLIYLVYLIITPYIILGCFLYFKYSFKVLNNKINWLKWNTLYFILPYIEIFSFLIKNFSSCFRMYSNFISGHLILILLFLLIKYFNIVFFYQYLLIFTLILTFIFLLINLLEIFIGWIQYYVILLLNTLFCSEIY